jgi:hypothetical protein
MWLIAANLEIRPSQFEGFGKQQSAFCEKKIDN